MKQEQTTRSHTARFKARLEAGGEGGAWVILKVPFDVEKRFGSKGRLSVSGTFNGTAYQTSIFPSGDGTHHMLVNKALQLAASAAAGDSVVVTMQPEREPRQVQIPADLHSALEERPALRAAFNALSPSRRKYIVQSIEGAKLPETRRRRIATAIRQLEADSALRSRGGRHPA